MGGIDEGGGCFVACDDLNDIYLKQRRLARDDGAVV